MADQERKTSDELAQVRTDLALQRTVAAAERTLMAWVRTSLSMISFGFTLYKFFQYLRESEHLHPARPYGPRNFGLALICLGTAALVIAAVQYRLYLARLGVWRTGLTWSLTFIVALLIALIGVLTFAGMLLHIGPF